MHGRNADPARRMVGFATDDITADWKRLQAPGVEFVEEPRDHGTVKVATFTDPDGNLPQLLQFAGKS